MNNKTTELYRSLNKKYNLFMVVGLIGLIESASRSILRPYTGSIDVGIVSYSAMKIFSIFGAKMAVTIGYVTSIILGFWLIWILIALIFKSHVKKAYKKLSEDEIKSLKIKCKPERPAEQIDHQTISDTHGLEKHKNVSKVYIYLSVTILSLTAIGLLFYWFQIRPSNVKRECHSWAGNQSGYDRIKSEYKEEKYSNYYRDCIREHGL